MRASRGTLRDRLTRRGMAPAGLPPSRWSPRRTVGRLVGGPDRQGRPQLRVEVRPDPGGDSSQHHRNCSRSVENHGDQEIDHRNGDDPRLRAHRGRFRRGPAFQAACEASRTRPRRPRAVPEGERQDRRLEVDLDQWRLRTRRPRDRAPAAWKKGAAVAGVQSPSGTRPSPIKAAPSLHLKKTAQRYFPIAQWSQEVKRQGKATRLKVVAFVKAQKMTKAILDVQFLDRSGEGSHQWAVYIGAKRSGDPPVTHDWKKYEGVVAIPDGTGELFIAAQIYGPGDVWFDDVPAEYTDAEPTDPRPSSRRSAATRSSMPRRGEPWRTVQRRRVRGGSPSALRNPDNRRSSQHRGSRRGSGWPAPAAEERLGSGASASGAHSPRCRVRRQARRPTNRRGELLPHGGKEARIAHGGGIGRTARRLSESRPPAVALLTIVEPATAGPPVLIPGDWSHRPSSWRGGRPLAGRPRGGNRGAGHRQHRHAVAEMGLAALAPGGIDTAVPFMGVVTTGACGIEGPAPLEDSAAPGLSEPVPGVGEPPAVDPSAPWPERGVVVAAA